jgi:hypothetical protein
MAGATRDAVIGVTDRQEYRRPKSVVHLPRFTSNARFTSPLSREAHIRLLSGFQAPFQAKGTDAPLPGKYPKTLRAHQNQTENRDPARQTRRSGPVLRIVSEVEYGKTL